MARKPFTPPVRTPAPVSTDVRNSPIPRAGTPSFSTAPRTTPRKEISKEAIAKRAYEIFLSGKGGTDMENWLRAERELRANS